jgi:peroxiredoxin
MRLLIAATLGAVLCAFQLTAAGELSGRRAPGFALPDGNMKYHDLGDYRGKVVLVEIMLTQCPNCQKLAQTLETLKQKYGDQLAVLAVVNPPDNRKGVTEFKAKYGITSPILFDCGQMVGSYLLPNPERPRIHVPHLFVIDGDGEIRNDFDYSNPEAFESKALEVEIDRLLK